MKRIGGCAAERVSQMQAEHGHLACLGDAPNGEDRVVQV